MVTFKMAEKNKDENYLVAYRFLEQACIQLENINSPISQSIKEKLKDGKRELEDVLW
jgi:hypothetical protein